MKPTPVLILLCSVLLACGGRDDLHRDQQQYEVVQEGASGTAASTIGGPGEVVPPPMPSMTGTNADTTTAFTLPTVTATGTQAPPGSIAGTLPQAGGPVTGLPTTPPSRPSTPSPRPAPVPTPQSPAVQPPPVPPPSTDTTATEPAEEEEEEEPEPEPQPEPQPQPQPPPTPPPTTTDTSGTFS